MLFPSSLPSPCFLLLPPTLFFSLSFSFFFHRLPLPTAPRHPFRATTPGYAVCCAPARFFWQLSCDVLGFDVSFALQPDSSSNFLLLLTPMVLLVYWFLLLYFFLIFSCLCCCTGRGADDINNVFGFQVEKGIVWVLVFCSYLGNRFLLPRKESALEDLFYKLKIRQS